MRKVLFFIGMFLFVVGVICLLALNSIVIQGGGSELVTTMQRFEFVTIADAIVGAILVSLNKPEERL